MIWIAAKEQNRQIKTKMKQKKAPFAIWKHFRTEQNTETDKTIDTQQPKFPCEMRINQQTDRNQRKKNWIRNNSIRTIRWERKKTKTQCKQKEENKKKKNTMNDKYSQSYKKVKTKIEAFYRIQFLKTSKKKVRWAKL